MGFVRMVLIIAVIIAHTDALFGLPFLPSHVAVQAFFIISGYFIAYVLETTYHQTSSNKRFFLNRFLKIFPTYWLILILVLGFSFIQLYISTYFSGIVRFPYNALSAFLEYFPTMNGLSKLFIVLSNIFIVGQDVFLFLGRNPITGNLFFTSTFWESHPPVHFFLLIPPSWMVATQIYFYILAPWVCKRTNQTLLIYTIVFLSIRLWFGYVGFAWDPWQYRFFPSECIFFFLGIWSYRIWKRYDNARIARPLGWTIFIAVLISTVFYGTTNTVIQEIIYYAFVAISIPIIVQLFQRSRVDRYIGELSYVFFISHILIVNLMDNAIVPTFFSRSLTAVVYGLGISILLYELIVKRFATLRVFKKQESGR